MRKTIFYLIPNLLIVLLGSFTGKAQPGDWNVNLPLPKTFTSINPKDDPGVTVDQMWQVSVGDLMNFPKSGKGQYGISASLNDNNNGNAQVSMYLYDPNAETGKGPLIFQCYTDKTVPAGITGNLSTQYNYGNWLAWWPQALEDRGHFYFNDYWSSNDAKSSMIAAAFYNYNQNFSGWNASTSDGTALIPYNKTDNKLPVIIELEIYKANVQSINLPGIGIIDENYFEPPYLDINYTLTSVSDSKVVGKLEIARLVESEDQIDISDVVIGLASFGNTSNFYATHVIPANLARSGYSNPTESLAGATPLDAWIIAVYDITVTDKQGVRHTYNQRIQFLCSFNQQSAVYTVNRQYYQGLPVFTLIGGKSAEYCVEKSIASLTSGISETWDVRSVNGKPDLKGGGPISVYADPNKYDFLQRSVEKTVSLYNDYLGKTTPFNTVIIGPGMAQAPYLSNAMKAPFLPLQFLVSVHSVAEVKRMLDAATAGGLSAFSMMGYDSTMQDVGVAWIKLRKLPPAYLQFLSDHQVQNVIIMGMTQDVAGRETVGRRIWLQDETAIGEDYSEGSMYLMKDKAVAESVYKNLYADYYRLNIGDNKYYVDWENGLTNNQAATLKAQLPPGITDCLIQSPDAVSFYRWGLDVQLAAMIKNAKTPAKLSMNEYLVGFPEYELYTSTIPYLYSQNSSSPSDIAFWAYKIGQFKSQIADDKFKNLPVYLQAKADRSALLNSLKNYFRNVTMDSWQQADVWDPADGMNSPCELVAQALCSTVNGVNDFTEWNESKKVFDFNDFLTMVKNSTPVPPADPKLFPKATTTSLVKQIPDAGLTIQKNAWVPNAYWQQPVIPDNISIESSKNVKLNGFVDGQYPFNKMRNQSTVIARFDLSNESDEYDLRVGYKFNVTAKDGLTSYDPKLDEEQNMNCFEFTSVPVNKWFDIPSRMMARSGAVWITNGNSYDFDHNGLPGVVSFIKKNGVIKSQPQILSYKGEGVFTWKWGADKYAYILNRPQNISGTGLPATMKTLFQKESADYPNAISGATFMSYSGFYDIKALQPDWMKSYPPFPSYYLDKGRNRCFFAPIAARCEGTEVVAPGYEGWNNCKTLSTDVGVQRASALAYQQYPTLSEDEPNARTFVALRTALTIPVELNIGVINGDYGTKGMTDKRIATKATGMYNYEVSQYMQYRNYSNLINLDGASASAMWLNGRGPLHDINGYAQAPYNQGPYHSRLQASFIMLIPKLHTELIQQKVQVVNQESVPLFDNTRINFNYSDVLDLDKDKSFIDLSPSLDSLIRRDGQYGLIAGNFSTSSQLNATKNGGILFYAGEDMHYPSARGTELVRAKLRNLMVVGIGMVLPGLRDSLLKIPIMPGADRAKLDNFLKSADVSAYYIKVAKGVITDFIFEARGKNTYLSGNHNFIIVSKGSGNSCNDTFKSIDFLIDGNDISTQASSYSFQSCLLTGFLDITNATHAYIGAMNLDGRFLTGDIAMKTYNYLFVSGRFAFEKCMDNIFDKLGSALAQNKLPNVGNVYFTKGIYAVQCLETTGQHVFALAPQGQNRFYGLRLNNFIFNKTKTPAKKLSKAKAK